MGVEMNLTGTPSFLIVWRGCERIRTWSKCDPWWVYKIICSVYEGFCCWVGGFFKRRFDAERFSNIQ